MNRILVVENSNFFGSIIVNRLRSDLGYQAVWVRNLAEMESTLEIESSPYFLALVDFSVPDAPDGQIIDAILAHNILPIVMTAELNDRSRDRIWSKKVVDYVIKEGPFAIDYLISLIKRISTNHETKVLVVDDSPVSRKHIGDLLAIQRYQTLFASDGPSCLKILDEQPDIQMMIVDYNMPGMQGDELTK